MYFYVCMYSTLAPPEVFFKCAMKIKLIELIAVASEGNE